MLGTSLSSLLGHSDRVRQVRKADLTVGDRVFVKTCNSVYRIEALGNGMYAVSGGWFDRKGSSPATTKIVGCSWGGSVIKVDVVAACGLRLEFGNCVVTSPVKKIFVMQHHYNN